MEVLSTIDPIFLSMPFGFVPISLKRLALLVGEQDRPERWRRGCTLSKATASPLFAIGHAARGLTTVYPRKERACIRVAWPPELAS
jgi:hypothetical protein